MMYLQTLLENKDYWQTQTIDCIKRQLFFYDGEEIVANKLKSEKLVVIYGMPQIGKTSLILNLLGIKDSGFASVYDTLRADVKYGNSSTSTAIIYRQSENELYGFTLKKSLFDSAEMSYLNESDFKEKLKEIRAEVEAKKHETSILFIAIPRHYFSENVAEYDNIDILDMPGVDSKNEKEKAHLEALFKTYMAVSSLCIIACKANEIQSLENFVLPNGDGKRWHDMPSRYIVVLTKSYSLGSVKKELAKNDGDFHNYITDLYQKELKKVFPDSKLEIYPVDVGDSFNKLIDDELKDSKEKLLDLRERVFMDIRESIQARRGNDLKNIIDNIGESVNAYAKEIKEDYDKEIEESNEIIKEYEADEKNAVEILKRLSEKIKEKQEEIESLRNDLIEINLDGISVDKFYERDIYKHGWLVVFLRNCLGGLFRNYSNSPTNPKNNKSQDFNAKISEKKTQKLKKLEDEKNRLDKEKIFIEGNQKNLKTKIDSEKTKKTEKEQDRKKIEDEKQHDDNLLSEYRKIAKYCFTAYKREQFAKMRDEKLSPAQKTAYMIYIGACEKDFKRIIGDFENE